MNKKQHKQILNKILKQMDKLGIPYKVEKTKNKCPEDWNYEIPLCKLGDLYIEYIKELIEDLKENNKSDIYIKIYNSFIDLDSGILDKVIVTPNEMVELGFIAPHNEVICDNNGDFVCKYIDARYCNYADILKKHFGDRLVQDIDIATGNYIFRKNNKGE